MNYLLPHWRSAVYNGQQSKNETVFEKTHDSPTRTPNHLHVYHDLDLVWLRVGQITDHLTVVIGVFNVNGIPLTGQN